MTIKEELRGNFPTSIDKTKTEFSALVANDKGTSAIETVLTNLLGYMAEWKNTKNMYEQTGTMLNKSANKISYLERFTDEKDEQFKTRLSAIFVRGGDHVWGTPFNVKRVFEQYFSLANVFVAENTSLIEDNLIKDYDFTNQDTDFWELFNAEISTNARFSKTFGVEFSANGTLKQTVDIVSGKAFYLHFFHKGKLFTQIKSNTNKYWNGKTWQDTIVSIERDSTEWADSQVFFGLLSDISSIEITFTGESGTYIDLIRLSEYKFPSFTVFIQIEGSAAKNSLALAKEKDDPVESINYDLAGYYEKDFLTGVAAGFAKDIYEDLLSYIKTEGVKAYLEVINKDYVE